MERGIGGLRVKIDCVSKHCEKSTPPAVYNEIVKFYSSIVNVL